MEDEMQETPSGLRPSVKQLTRIALLLDDARRQGHRRIMLSWLPEWRRTVGCRTEDLVEMIGYLVETSSPIVGTFSLDMHLVDAIIQCRLRREGTYRRSEWTGEPDTEEPA